MPDGREPGEYGPILSEVNERDTPALLQLTGQLAQQPAVGLEITRFVGGCGFDAPGSPYSDGLAPLGFDVDARGARAFTDILTMHPAFAEGRRLGFGLAIVGEPNSDANAAGVRRDAAELLVAGALAFGVLGLSEDMLDPLVNVAFGPEAFSGVLRTSVLGRPPLDQDAWPAFPDWLTDFGPPGPPYDCVLGILHALTGLMLSVRGGHSNSYATGITSLNPNVGCDDQTIAIEGSGFGKTQPADVSVLFPHSSGACVKANVVSWSDTEIFVKVPKGVSSGCVGFLSQVAAPDGGSLAEAGEALAGELEGCLGQAASNAAQRLRQAGPVGIVHCPPCLPGGANRFSGGGPIIDQFAANGDTSVFVEPGDFITLSWRTTGAISVTLSPTTPTAPWIPPSGPLPVNGMHPAGFIAGSRPSTAKYQLVARNACGTVSRSVEVHLRKTPKLTVTAIEVVQAIQRADNSVRLVAGKATVVRVFVASGLTGGFDYGPGPDIQPGVGGTLVAFPASAGRGFDAGEPLPPGSLDAQPAAAIARGTRTHSLNFELPLAACTGKVRLDVRVAVKDHELDIGGPFVATGTTTVTFHDQPTQVVEPYLIVDVVNGVQAPSVAQYNASLQEARKRFPIAETGFFVTMPPTPFSTGSARDLVTGVGWSSLLNALATLAFVHTGAIRTGLVPQDPGNLRGPYALNGMAFPRFGLTMPAMLAQAGLQGTFAHEMGHTFSVNHAPCCTTFWDNIDGRLPGRTEDVGFDVPANTVIPAGRGELMSYCGDTSLCSGPTRWPSIALWDILFDSLGI